MSADVLALGIKEFKEYLKKHNVYVLDTRLPDYFENGFITGSINIPFKENFKNWLSYLFEPTAELLLICKPNSEKELIMQLNEAGYLNIKGYLKDGFSNWINQHNSYDMIISISGEEVVLDAKHNKNAVVIDVRTAEDYKMAHLQMAVNLPLANIKVQARKLNPLAETLIYSNSGLQSMIACSYLKHIGFKNVKNVWGGFNQIKQEEKATIETN